MTDQQTRDKPLYRLHPFSLMYRFIVSLPALAILLIPAVRSPDTGNLVSILSMAFYGIFIIPLLLAQYLRFRYRITHREIIIESGVITRKHRSIPIERIHNIEIEQSLLPRLFGTAKVKIETAGSTQTEGVLEYVSLKEAKRIRRMLRDRQEKVAGETSQLSRSHDPVPTVDGDSQTDENRRTSGETGPERLKARERIVFSMPLSHVLLSGVFRFSLIYIVLIFTVTEYAGINPDDLVLWMSRQSLEPVSDFFASSPWIAAVATIFIAGLFAWITGILVNLNRFYRFRLSLDGKKLHKKHGLLTLSEGTIPVEKVQALIFRTNPLMRAFGWYRLEIQTMGIDEKTKGHQVAIPFAKLETIIKIAQLLRSFKLPHQFNKVSPLTKRRAFIRYFFLLSTGIIAINFFWKPVIWFFLSIPLLYYISHLRYLNLGYAAVDDILFVRRGILRNLTWLIPFDRFQVFYMSGSIFQRRLHLRSLTVDTGGADPFRYPVIVDLPEMEAERQLESLYTRFQTTGPSVTDIMDEAGAPATNRDRDTA